MAKQLRPYQWNCLQAIKRAVENGKRRFLVRMATGGGKTFCFAHLPWLLNTRRVMVVAHRGELLTQAAKHFTDLGFTTEIEKAEQIASPGCQIVVASLQTLKNGRLNKFNPVDFDLLVIDECFPAGTLIDGKTIESLKKGDTVNSFDEKTKQFVSKKITHIFKKVPKKLICVRTTTDTIVCTPNHPVYTTRGWVPAGLLTPTDMVLCFTYEQHKRTMQLVQHSVYFDKNLAERTTKKNRQSVLFHRMWKTSTYQKQFRNNESNQSQVCVSAYESKKSYEQPNCASQTESNAQSYGLETSYSRRQRKTIADSTVNVGMHTRLGNRSGYSNWPEKRNGSTDSLQSGHRGTNTQDCYRSRREFSLFGSTANTRSEERQTINWVRVESVKILEQTSDGTFGGMCPDGFVYNLEIEDTHTYIANNIVVHNCHHATNINSYRRLVDHFSSAVTVGFTATPYRLDRKDLNEVFTDGVVFNLGMIDLIKQGHLTPIQMIDQEIFSKFDPGHVFSAYRKHVDGLKSVVFCKDIAHSVAMAEMFTANGVPALPVYSGLPKDERKRALDKFAKGEIQVLSSVGVLTEGYDEPSIQSIVLARNTTSRALYEQMLGRGVRLHENKTKLKVLQLIPTPPPQSMPAGEKVRYAWEIIKRVFWLAILACLVGWLWKTCSEARLPQWPGQSSSTYLRATTACKLRSKPSLQASTVGLVGPTDLLVRLDQTKTNGRTWTQVRTRNKTGWCGCRLEVK